MIVNLEALKMLEFYRTFCSHIFDSPNVNPPVSWQQCIKCKYVDSPRLPSIYRKKVV